MSISSKWVAPPLVLLAAAACGGQTLGDLDAGGDAASSGGDGGPCTTSAQCGPGGACGFAESAGCAALGQCFQVGPVCKGFSPGCSCQGQTINAVCNGLPNGYARAPLMHLGACEAIDAGPGPGDAAAMFPCGSTACVPGQDICYVPANVGPDAGTCMPSNGCTDCACAQAMFQCISTCKQSGPAIYIQCQ